MLFVVLIIIGVIIICGWIGNYVSCLESDENDTKRKPGIYVNGKYYPPGLYYMEDGSDINCGTNGNICLRGNGNKRNVITSGV